MSGIYADNCSLYSHILLKKLELLMIIQKCNFRSSCVYLFIFFGKNLEKMSNLEIMK